VDQRPVTDQGLHEQAGVPTAEVGVSWRLASPQNAKTQALVVGGFSSLPTGRALFLEFVWDEKGKKGSGAWLKALAEIAPVTNADGREEKAAALAFAYTGLVRMGLAKSALESFAAPFKEGMMQEDRLRRLHDRRKGVWEKTVIDGGPKWSANTRQRGALTEVEIPQSQALTATGHQEEQIETPITVHALLLLYDADEVCAQKWADDVEAKLKPFGVNVVHTLPLDLRLDELGVAREHFGFADGISQPIPYDAGGAVTLKGGATIKQPDKWNGVPLGELVFGYTNGHHEKAPGPIVPDDKEGVGRAAGLEPSTLAEGSLDLGINGSYMVVRELKQDVAAFWKSMREGADLIRQRDPDHSSHVTTTWLAERAVGRSTKGDLLCPDGYLQPTASGQPQNDFFFYERDPFGVGCPVGSHVRRANPRDGLTPISAKSGKSRRPSDPDAPLPGAQQTMLDAANNHRILRRGRKYGSTIAVPVPEQDDMVDRGLLFICLNTDIARQFEFVQQTWMFNPNFATLYDETDPLIGPCGQMTVHEKPLRRRIDVQTFVKMAGGDYFFLPSMPALKYFESL
jgi:deferrochelatase/peroxidase EfeB